jgi:hypothetical protein
VEDFALAYNNIVFFHKLFIQENPSFQHEQEAQAKERALCEVSKRQESWSAQVLQD